MKGLDLEFNQFNHSQLLSESTGFLKHSERSGMRPLLQHAAAQLEMKFLSFHSALIPAATSCAR